MAKKDEPVGEDPRDGDYDGGSEPVSLGDAAQAGLAAIGDGASQEAGQGVLEGMDYTKVQFVGVQFDSLETPVKIGDEMVFLVKGRVKAVGDEQMNDGHVRHVAKVKVDSVALHDMGLDGAQG